MINIQNIDLKEKLIKSKFIRFEVFDLMGNCKLKQKTLLSNDTLLSDEVNKLYNLIDYEIKGRVWADKSSKKTRIKNTEYKTIETIYYNKVKMRVKIMDSNEYEYDWETRVELLADEGKVICKIMIEDSEEVIVEENIKEKGSECCRLI